ncbi:hypothetical protein LB465_16870 [Salegentibacter sp. LM13S]|uniref:S41 family peptidase n=1 Tax=Salegentibacter lacus TaxID=2873599 RepID=UPI001CCBF4FA|nr:S41 family peptidase [Salegentibacter lacus]MBZ9632456.1 hypothetical protein [Salegentibacter lacus]
MKKFFLAFLITSLGYGQNISESEITKQIGLIWGLLKYHHPDVSRGEYNWDQKFLSLLEKSNNIKDQESLNTFLLNFIDDVKVDNSHYKTKRNLSDSSCFLKNIDYGWINGFDFNNTLKKELYRLRDNSNIGDFYASAEWRNNFLNFQKENGLPNFDSSLKNHRLLLFYNFWNVIQYYYVNKYMTEEDWREILIPLTKEFIQAKNDEQFEMAKLKMIAKLSDSHSFNLSPFLFNSIINYKPAFSGRIVNDSLVVTSIKNQALANKDSIKLGDVITSIKGLPLGKYIQKKFAPITSASNGNYLRRFLEKGHILSDSVNKISVSVFRPTNNTSREIVINLYDKRINDSIQNLYDTPSEASYDLTSEIGYINLGEINSNELKKVLQSYKRKKGIVLDLRNYPKAISKSDLSNFLYPKRKKFVKVLFPLEGQPSLANPNGKAPFRFISNPFKTGKKNKDYYKGKVILLVDRNTMSNAEYIAMMIQASPNCITIGEQTAGSVLNVWTFNLSDKQKIYFTGLGAFYPDGREAQRKGVHLDYHIKNNAVRYNPNLYIEKAVQIINENKLSGHTKP